MSKQRTIYSIATAAKNLVQRGDASKDRAEEFYARAGGELKQLKERKPKGETWKAFVRAQCDLSQERADELIRIHDKATDVATVRANTAERVQKHRKAKSVLRNTGSPPAAKRPEPFPPFKPGEGCDYESTDQQRWEGEPYRVTRKRGFLGSVNEALRLSRQNLFMVDNRAKWAVIDPSEITDEVIEAAQSVVDAWLECVKRLQQMSERKAHGKATSETGAVIH